MYSTNAFAASTSALSSFFMIEKPTSVPYDDDVALEIVGTRRVFFAKSGSKVAPLRSLKFSLESELAATSASAMLSYESVIEQRVVQSGRPVF